MHLPNFPLERIRPIATSTPYRPEKSPSLRKKLAILLLQFLTCWFAMVFFHEIGHLIGGWLTGAQLLRFDLTPWRLPYSIHYPNPHPQITLWSGPLLGIAIPFMVRICFRSTLTQMFLSLALLANGTYLLAGLWGNHTELDTQRLLATGTSSSTIAIYCLLTMVPGYLGLRRRCIEHLQPTPAANLLNPHGKTTATKESSAIGDEPTEP